MSRKSTALRCKYRVEVSTAEQLEQALSCDFEYVYAPLDIARPDDRVIVIPPIFGKFDLSGFARVCVNNIGHFCENKILHGGFRLNITNSSALTEYERLGLTDSILSIELNLQRAKSLTAQIPRGLVVYGNLPMMLHRRPIDRDFLTDRKGKIHPIVCTNGEYEQLNPDVLYLADKMHDFTDFDFVVLRLSPGECIKSIYEVYRMKRKYRKVLYNKNFTRGLYYK